MEFIRRVKTASGATAIQIASKQKGQIVKIIHMGSTHTEEELNVLLLLARKLLQGDQLELLPEPQPSLRVGLIAYYHQLFQVEATFRMAKSDLKVRPIYHRKRDAIEAYLTIVLAALAISRNIDGLTGISIKQFVKLLRPIRSGIVTINEREILAEPEIPEQVKTLLKHLTPGH